MWDNVGRVIAEYAFLDRLWESGRVVIDQPVLDWAGRVRASGRPVLLFGVHLANWELGAVALTALGLKLAVVYRPPDFAPVAKEILELRERLMGRLIPAGPGAAMRLKQALAQGMSVGMLIDQHFATGIDVMFFGRPCKVNPTLARFARLTGYAIHGVRTVRLPAGRFRIELSDAVTAPRDRKGEIDVTGTTQMIASVMEGWIRQNPEQWLWMHRRWR